MELSYSKGVMLDLSFLNFSSSSDSLSSHTFFSLLSGCSSCLFISLTLKR